MYQLTIENEFDMGHRLLGYEGCCSCLHGHRYKVETTVQGKELDSLGMLIDFIEIKKTIDEWLESWDHHTLLNADDPLVEVLGYDVTLGNGNPTAENMAQGMFHAIAKNLPKNITLKSIRLWETPGCSVTYTED